MTIFDKPLPPTPVLQTQRLALAREAATSKLTVHVTHQNDSSIVDSLQVDYP